MSQPTSIVPPMTTTQDTSEATETPVSGLRDAQPVARNNIGRRIAISKFNGYISGPSTQSTSFAANLNAALPTLWAHGLPRRYDDVITANLATDDVAAVMSRGHHYDYQTQQWVDGHDHAHFVSNDHAAPLLFCGADAQTCFGIGN